MSLSAKPAELAEKRLVVALLEGVYPPGGALPGERDLAVQLGVTRPTMREALQRLSRDGWLLIQQGKPTIVNDFWRDGGLNVLGALANHREHLSPQFITNLLEVRLDLAPSYARLATLIDPAAALELLAAWPELDETAEAYADFDWQVHRALTSASANPIYSLILNGFASLAAVLALYYFSFPAGRAASRDYYAALEAAIRAGDPATAEAVTRAAMRRSLELWAAQVALDPQTDPLTQPYKG